MMDMPTENRVVKAIVVLHGHNFTLTKEMEAELPWIKIVLHQMERHLMEMREMKRSLDAILLQIAEPEHGT